MNTNKDWIYRTNIYEVNLRQYTNEGTFQAFAPHLPRLRDMGVETLWFMPITPISQIEKKGSMGSYYACADYTSINPEFGSLDDFKALVRDAQALGFKVIIDWVANHTGWDHVWTRQNPNWYEKDNGQFKRASGMDDIIELDYKNPDLRRAMTGALKFWVEECGLDGFRCDLAFWVELDYWQEAIPEVNKLGPLFWLAESDPLENPAYMQVFDAAYTWTWMHKTEEWYKKGLPLDFLIQILEQYQQAPGIKAWFTSNHDENTWNGSEYEKYGKAALLLAVHSCTWPGIPLVYSGQELPNKKRLAFFDKDPIEWTGRFELHDFYKTLLHLHSTHPALDARSEVYRLQTSANDRILAYLRKKEDSEVLVLLHFSEGPIHFDLTDNRVQGSYTDPFTHAPINLPAQRSFDMEAWTWKILVR